jgi:N-formylglutamate amidohydrolase
MQRRSVILLPMAAMLGSRSHAGGAADLVASSAGSMPLLLTVPHDGDQLVAGVAARTNGATVRDVGTRELAERTADLLGERLGKRPFLVVARFSRKVLDANRAEAEVMESKEMLPAYRAYHDRIAGYIEEIRQMFPGGALLVDVHGQSQEPDVIFRGTRNGLTTSKLLGRHGIEALQGERSVLGALASKGLQVHPALGQPSLREDARYAGGHTVFTYGSHMPGGIDAIQFEFGRNVRADRALAEHFAAALLVFMSAYGLLAK